MDPQVQHLLSLSCIRSRSQTVALLAESNQLSHFTLHLDKLDSAVDFVAATITRDFGPDKFHAIPPHGRWQHFEVGGVPRVERLLEAWRRDGVDEKEVTRRLVDLFFVSVLLDAGAGDEWRYKELETGEVYERSEGIAVASLHMFEELAFAAVEGEGKGVPVADGKGLEQLGTEKLVEGFQVADMNPMLGVESRAALLRSLGKSLLAHAEVFGAEGRPGNLVDYLLSKAGNSGNLDVLVLWDVLQTLLIPAWPKNRTTIAGTPIGDAWPLRILQQKAGTTNPDNPEGIHPFHKLTQWLTYSLMVPFQRVLGKKWDNADSLTALPEYRNGGLFVDLGVITLKPKTLARGLEASGCALPQFEAGDDAIVEWRALTLILIDKLYAKIQARFGAGVHLSMAQLLEAGTWKSGRAIAAQKRPQTKSSPILIKSDGTVF